MKVYTREQLIKRLKICSVLGIASVIFFVATMIAMEAPLGVTALSMILAIVAFPIEVFGMSFNFGKNDAGFNCSYSHSFLFY